SRRRHTRFKCDWSSDVCSSDLERRDEPGWAAAFSVLSPGSFRRGLPLVPREGEAGVDWTVAGVGAQQRGPGDPGVAGFLLHSERSEERRVGKEGGVGLDTRQWT